MSHQSIGLQRVRHDQVTKLSIGEKRKSRGSMTDVTMETGQSAIDCSFWRWKGGSQAERSKETASLELLQGLQPCQQPDLVKLLASGTVRWWIVKLSKPLTQWKLVTATVVYEYIGLFINYCSLLLLTWNRQHGWKFRFPHTMTPRPHALLVYNNMDSDQQKEEEC